MPTKQSKEYTPELDLFGWPVGIYDHYIKQIMPVTGGWFAKIPNENGCECDPGCWCDGDPGRDCDCDWDLYELVAWAILEYNGKTRMVGMIVDSKNIIPATNLGCSEYVQHEDDHEGNPEDNPDSDDDIPF